MRKKKTLFWVILILITLFFLEASCRVFFYFYKPKNICRGVLAEIYFHKRFVGFEIPLRHSQLLGWDLIPGKHISENTGVTSINKQGFRQLSDVAPKKTTPRLLLAGDSYIYGDEVQDTKTISYHLNKLIPSIEILNSGVLSYGQDQMYLRYLHNGIKFNPDIVVIGLVSIDIRRNDSGFFCYYKPFYKINRKKDILELYNSKISIPITYLKAISTRSRFFDLLESIYENIFISQSDLRDYQYNLSEKILLKFIDKIKEQNSIPILLYIPYKEGNNIYDKFEKEYYGFAKKNGVDFISTTKIIKDNYYKICKGEKTIGHWNGVANKIIAKQIYQHLQDHKYLTGVIGSNKKSQN